MENNPNRNTPPIEKLIFESLFPNAQMQKKAAYDELFLVIDHVLDRGDSITLQISHSGDMTISCIPMEKENDEKY